MKKYSKKKVFTFQTAHILLEIRYRPNCFNAEIDHYEFVSIQPMGSPHPLSETGYKSLFIHPEWTRQSGGAEGFIKFAIEQAAKEPVWKDYLANAQQLSLF